MADVPINPLTQTPSTGPGLVDQYYRKQGISPPYEVIKGSDKLIDTLEMAGSKANQQFLGYTEKQLDAYYDSLQANPDDQKRLQSIVGGDADAQSALVRYGNLKKNFSVLTQLLQGKKLQDPEVVKQVQDPLIAQIKKNGIEIGAKPDADELQQKAVLLWMKLRQDTGKAGSRFYNRVAWDLWSSKKSSAMDKLVARDYLDAAWYASSLKSPAGNLLERPGIYNQLLRDQVAQGLKSSHVTPFVSHKAFFSKTTGRDEALGYLENLPDAFQKADEKVEKDGGKQTGASLEVFPFMKAFSQKAFTADKVNKAVAAYQKGPHDAGNTLNVDEAFQAFGNYIQAAAQNPKLNAKLEYMIFWDHPDIQSQLEKVQGLQQKARDQEGNVVNKTADKQFQKAAQVYYLKLARALRDDKRSTPEEKALAADYVNAVALAEKNQRKPQPAPAAAHGKTPAAAPAKAHQPAKTDHSRKSS